MVMSTKSLNGLMITMRDANGNPADILVHIKRNELPVTVMMLNGSRSSNIGCVNLC
jgi:hypothetical protein